MTRTAEDILDVAIIGTGFAGLCMAIRLQELGQHSFVVLERASSVGGTWRENTYPGAACDVQSHVYSFSFAPNPEWSWMFGRQPEILAYLEWCTERYRLAPRIRFDTEVVAARFDDRAGHWTLQLAGGEELRARAVVSGTGGLNRPKYPNIDGLDSFAGERFHSSRWNHQCAIADRRVAVIGTGASAIQVVPQLAQNAAQLHVFQRTPAWVLPKPDRAISEREKALYRRLPAAQIAHRLALYWRLELRGAMFVSVPRVMEHLQKLVTLHIKRSVADLELRARLIPQYTLGCKRVLIANDYYPALQEPHVSVITEPIARIEADAVVTADGRAHACEVLVLCTGFHAADEVAPFPVSGLDGTDLSTVWRDGASAYLGTTVARFPNLFLMTGPNTGLGHNSMVFMIESQVNYVLSCLRALRKRSLRYIDVRADVQSRFNDNLQKRMQRTVWMSGCASWYQNENGKITTLWPGYPAEYRARTWRVNLRDYHCVP